VGRLAHPHRPHMGRLTSQVKLSEATIDVSYAAPQAHEIVNVALYQKYSPGIIFIFFQGRNDLYHV
jgi:hypothetical protein